MDAARFLSSIRAEVLEPGDVVDETALKTAVERLMPAARQLEDTDDWSSVLDNSEGTQLAALLLGVPVTELVERPAEAAAELQRWRDWTLGAPVVGVIVGLLLRDAHMSRSRRRRTKLVEVVQQRLKRLTRGRLDLQTRTNASLPLASRSFDFVVLKDGEPILAVLVIFQTRAGGRQTENFEALPDLQSALIRRGVVLAVVADGAGFGTMSQVVRRVGPRLQHLMNVTGLRRGELKSALERAERVHAGELLIADSESEDLLDRVARVALQSGQAITPKVLNTPVDETGAFFVQFIANHGDYDLMRTEEQGLIAAASSDLAAISRLANGVLTGPLATELIAEHLGYRHERLATATGVPLHGLTISDSRLRLPAPLPVFEITNRRGVDRTGLISSIDDELTSGPLISRLALVIDTIDADATRRAAQGPKRSGRPQLAVLGSEDVAEIVIRRQEPGREFFGQKLVENVDLRLISPFISEGPAPEQMFFGRETEIRRVMEQAGTQSFALVGGRKVGKTSILRHLDRLLRERIPVVSLDCQAHPDRGDFLRYVQELTPQPSAIEDGRLVASAERVLSDFVAQTLGGEGGVMLLDEVDDLFLADSIAAEHPHVLSRSFRSLAQLRTAAIIVTGERGLFKLTRDASSPHWNFCTPIIIGPLHEDAAASLLIEPLDELGIRVSSSASAVALDRTARHPNLLQFLGDQVVATFSDVASRGQRIDLTQDFVEDIVGTGAYQNCFLATFWSQASTLEKVLSLLLSPSDPASVDGLVGALGESHVDCLPSDISEALTYLELYTIAFNPGTGWVLRDPVFDFYLSPVRGTAIAREWMGELR